MNTMSDGDWEVPAHVTLTWERALLVPNAEYGMREAFADVDLS